MLGEFIEILEPFPESLIDDGAQSTARAGPIRLAAGAADDGDRGGSIERGRAVSPPGGELPRQPRTRDPIAGRPLGRLRRRRSSTSTLTTNCTFAHSASASSPVTNTLPEPRLRQLQVLANVGRALRTSIEVRCAARRCASLWPGTSSELVAGHLAGARPARGRMRPGLRLARASRAQAIARIHRKAALTRLPLEVRTKPSATAARTSSAASTITHVRSVMPAVCDRHPESVQNRWTPV